MTFYKYFNPSYRWRQFFLLVFLTLLFTEMPVRAVPSKDTDHKADKNLKSSARVNPSTLAMEFSLPLGEYPGRAGNGVPVIFNYSSKIWNEKHFNTLITTRGVYEAGNPPLTEDRFFSTNSILEFGDRTSAGWTSGMQPPAILGVPEITIYDQYGEVYNLRTGDPVSDPDPKVIYWIKRVQIQLPDGSSHELRSSETPVNCSLSPQDCFTLGNGTYLSVDGSRLKLVIGEVQPDQTTRTVLYTPDGGRYFFASQTLTVGGSPSIHTFAEFYIDRHGNKVSFNYNGSNRAWTDTLGRSINDPLPNGILGQFPAVGTQNFQLPGINGQNRTYSAKWKKLKADGCITGTEPSCQESALNNPSEQLYYAGYDTCDKANIDNSLSPSLFGATIAPYINVIVEGDHRVREIHRDRICAVSPPNISQPDDAPPPPVTTFNPIVLADVVMPDGSKYEFKYNVYGEITKIIYPTGGYERFRYDQIPTLSDSNGSPTNRGVVERWVSFDGISETQHWQYAASVEYGSGTNWHRVTITAPDDSQTQSFLHRSTVFAPFGFENPLAGMPFEQRVFSQPDPVGGQRKLLRRALTEYDTSPPRTGGHSAGRRNARQLRQITITLENNSNEALAAMSENEYGDEPTYSGTPEYFADLNATKTKTYHYKTVARSTAEAASTDPNSIDYFKTLFGTSDLASVAETDFLYSANYTARNISGLASEMRVKDALGSVKSKSQITYDESGYLESASITNAPGWTNSGNSYRSLATSVRNWTDISNNQYIETHASYDQFGNPRKSWDGRGNFTETQYLDNYTDSVNRSSYALPTKTISYSGANGTGTIFETSVKYDFNTGLLISTTDANGQTSQIEYNDALLRPTKAIAPNGQQTITKYGAPGSSGQLPANQRFFKVKAQIDDQKWKEGFTWFDGLGRTIKTQKIDSGGDVFDETEYDNMSRPKKTTNPYRANETKLWTENFYDDLSRIIKVKTPDNAEVLTTYSLATTGNQIGEIETISDEAGKSKRRITDVLDNLTRVDEPDDNNQLGLIDNPVQPTYYGYDANENLIQIIQGGQTRAFVYDSLNRLKQATNPESGTFQYSYDNNGNLLTKTDARGVSTNYTYDALNRVTLRNYSDATPDISYVYDDPNVPFSKGKLTKVSSSVSETLYTAFDADDNVLSSRQMTDGQIYDFGYTYNLSGDLATQTYPSTKVIRYDYSADGDLAQVKNNLTQKIYANSFGYTAHGQIEKLRLGNGKWETTKFNSSLQITEIGLGHSATDTGLWKTAYEYGEWESGAINPVKNNGNVARQTISVPTVGTATGFTAVQNYTYDKLDRLKTTIETVGGVEKWKQAFNYDRFGNKRFNPTGTTLLSSESNVPKVADPEILPTNNKYKEDQDGDGQADYLYDAAGNITKNAKDQTFTYDGENRQTTAIGSNLSMSYAYDGNDKRVKTFNSLTNQTTIFVYDASGDLAAEYTVNTPPPTNPTVSYLTEDALGSVRIVTNSFGDVKARRDFLPFGEELFAGIGNRNITQKYSTNADDTREKFATYQRDVETGLDYAQSRYYSPITGRFTSPDEFKGGPDELFDFEDDASDNPTFYADLTNPQSLNKYQYSYNNPYKYNDPTGHCPPFPCALAPIVVPVVSDVIINAVGVSALLGITAANADRTPDANLGDGSCPSCDRNLRAAQIRMAKANSNSSSGNKSGGQVNSQASGSMNGSGGGKGGNNKNKKEKSYQTYTKTDKNGKVYVGRTSGKGTPQQNIANRDRGHHRKGMSPAKLDKSSKNKKAIRGREQQVIDRNRRNGNAVDQINGISPTNPKRKTYMKAAEKEFGKP